ncbi:hypothetical protein NECAME_05490 [Necator americanus]|uniref:Uncharacterized protein n=1 Tax=Necator americanus TaxID=51031 RepID=W2SGB8_NECAM|nr:hypothetical protein NECAME_05490 [Necator americanus]ETN68645.1 hypothetical protein NECAME_05490 [Necator americanus]
MSTFRGRRDTHQVQHDVSPHIRMGTDISYDYTLNIVEECLSKHPNSMKKINKSFTELQEEVLLVNEETGLLDNLAAISQIMEAPSKDASGSTYLFQFLNHIVCGGGLSDGRPDEKTGGDINTNQLNRLGILQAMLRRNAKVLYAPNITIVDQVIAKVQ